MSVSLAPRITVAGPLLEYLRDRLAIPDLDYRQAPRAIPDGWETFIFRFQLHGAARLPAAFSRPLILRAYASVRGTDRLLYEFSVQKHLHALGYPAPKPLWCEADASILGGPFMIMEWLPGRTLMDLMFGQPWRIVTAPGQMACIQARLHQLSAETFPAPPGSFLDRHLANLHDQIESHDLHGLRPGFDWLRTHRPPEPVEQSILHLDFHPLNLLFHEGQCRGVLDWGDADVGDRHADVAVTLVLIESTPVEAASLWRHLSAWPGRILLYRRYRRGYRALLPLDDHRLRYFMAWAGLRRLGRYGTWLRAGPLSTGCKPACLGHVNRDGINSLCRGFYRRTGISAEL